MFHLKNLSKFDLPASAKNFQRISGLEECPVNTDLKFMLRNNYECLDKGLKEGKNCDS